MSNSVEFIKHDRTMPTDNWYKISYFLSVGDEKEAAKIIDYRLGNASHMQQRALLLYMDSFTDKKLLFDLILSVYTNDGYDFPKKIIQKAKQLARDIPENERLYGLPSKERFIRVWRGTTIKDPEAASLLRTSISWTTDKSVAVFFANRCGGVVWEGIIDRKKIIAFCQDRNESEVLQHMNIRDAHIIDISAEEWARALEERRRSHEASVERLRMLYKQSN